MKVRPRGEEVRRYLIDNLDKYPESIAKVAAAKFKISRQAVNKHLSRLANEKTIIETGKTRARSYKLAPLVEWRKEFPLFGSPAITEDFAWSRDVREALGPLPDNVLKIWNHGFTEIFNNAIDHSGGTSVLVHVVKDAAQTKMLIADNGVGIFKKIQTALQLLDERHSVLELAKGKFTTDPKNHSGEGIFFTSRMFDDFWILSGGVAFSHHFGHKDDWIQEVDGAGTDGTNVFMILHNHTSRTTSKVFDQFTTSEDLTFSKTVVPVDLVKYGDDNLVSRSQAKRLMARVELFKEVILDFKGVPSIGQGFADEIFRVFAREHPGVNLITINANSEVKRMIERAKADAETVRVRQQWNIS